MKMTTRARRVGVSLIGAVALVHCSKSSIDVGGATPPPLPPATPDTSQACVTIGPEGGSITHPAKAQIVIPAGALDAPTSICLTGIAAPSSADLGAPALGQAFDASPSGQVFRKPIDVYLPFDAARMTPGATLRQVELRMAPQGTHDFVSLSSNADLQSGRVHAQTVHFTEFVPAQNPNPVFITTNTTLPPGIVGQAYAQPLAADGGTAPYAWAISPLSVVPPGLAVVATGSLAGTPSLPNNYGFFLTASDAAGHSVQAAFSLLVTEVQNPVPTLASVAPNSAQDGSPTTITLTGSQFAPTAVAVLGGTPLATTFVSATTLTATVPAASGHAPGSYPLAVVNPAPGGGTTASLPFAIVAVAQNPLPAITAVTPNLLPVTSTDVQITITGSSFIASTSAAIGAQGIPTRYVSPTALTATIPAANLAAPGHLLIDVYTPPPGGGFSATSVDVTVGALNPVPTLVALSPASVAAGSDAFTLTASGTGFVTGGQLFFGTTALATTIASATSATATVPSNLVFQAMTAPITFVNPAPGGGASGALTFTVTASNDGGSDGSDGSMDDAAADAGDASSVLSQCSMGNACVGTRYCYQFTLGDCGIQMPGVPYPVCRYSLLACDGSHLWPNGASLYIAADATKVPTFDCLTDLTVPCPLEHRGEACRGPVLTVGESRVTTCIDGVNKIPTAGVYDCSEPRYGIIPAPIGNSYTSCTP